MESINFINPVPHQKQKALILWFYGSLLLLILLLGSLTYFYVIRTRACNQLVKKVNELKHQTMVLEALTVENQKLVEAKKKLEEQLQEIKALLHHDLETPHDLMLNLATLIPEHMCLTILDGKPGASIVLEGFAYDAQTITQFLHALQNCPLIANMHLVSITKNSLESSKPLLKFTLQGLWKLQQRAKDYERIST
jgi:Tfp pilus assembly protein PilN